MTPLVGLRYLRLGSLYLLATSIPHVSADSGTIWATPHDSYSSSVGVLGCYVNTNRIAYWPPSVSCNDICIKLTYNNTRSVTLLRVDQSQGAHDISYDAWNYLITGESASKDPTTGGGVEMTWEDVDASECAHHLNTKHSHIPLSASNSMNFLASCLEDSSSYVAQNYVLYNILDSTCQWGYDETCELVDYPNHNQPQCSHALGTPNTLQDTPVWNIIYPTGQKVKVGDVANYSYTAGAPNNADSSEEDAAFGLRPSVMNIAFGAVGSLILAAVSGA